MRKLARETGAAAVEFAIVFPLLIILLAGITDFGRAFHAQIVLTNAAREGVRMIAMGNDTATIDARMGTADFGIGIETDYTAPCTSGSDAEMTVRPDPAFEWIFLDDILKIIPGGTSLADPDLDATGIMRCNG